MVIFISKATGVVLCSVIDHTPQAIPAVIFKFFSDSLENAGIYIRNRLRPLLFGTYELAKDLFSAVSRPLSVTTPGFSEGLRRITETPVRIAVFQVKTSHYEVQVLLSLTTVLTLIRPHFTGVDVVS